MTAGAQPMHELSVCIALLESVQSIATQHHSQGVAKIVLKIGPLSGVEPELLRNAYPLAAAGTIAADAELVIEPDAVVVRCTECGAESVATPNRLLCDQCGDYRTRLISGDQMTLQTVELVAAAAPTDAATRAFTPTH